MIHVFNVCCKYPCEACDGACKGCSKCAQEVCGGCGQLCEPCSRVLDRPLGSYVVMTGCLNLPACLFAVIGIADREVRACSASPMTIFCLTNVVLGILHSGFALYLQQRLVSGMQSQTFMGQQAAELGAADPNHMPTSKELMKRAGNILLYDIGFCVYVFVFVGSFGFNCAGMGWAADCPGASLPGLSAGLMLFFAFLAVGFFILWYCSLACDSAVGGVLGTRARPSGQPAQQNRGLARVVFGRTMGAPMAQVMMPGVVHQTHPPAAGQPMFGQPAPPAGPAPTAYGSPQGKPAGGASSTDRARQGAAVVGRGLQGLGRMLQGGGQRGGS